MLHRTKTQTALPKRKSKVEAGRNEEGTLVEIEGYNKVLVSFFVGEDRDGCVLGIVRFTDYYTGRLAWLHHPLFVSATHPGDILCNTPFPHLAFGGTFLQRCTVLGILLRTQRRRNHKVQNSFFSHR